MGQDKTVQVEVVVAFPEAQEIVDMVIPAGTTVREAVSRAQLTKYFPELDVGVTPLAVWGKVVTPDHLLRDGDRVELLRQLEIDPKEARRELANAGRYMGSARPDNS